MVSGTITVKPQLEVPTVSSNSTNCFEEVGPAMTAIAKSGGNLIWSLTPNFETILDSVPSVIPFSTAGVTSYYVREELAGCISDPSTITITVHYCKVDAPTAFTPDGDNVNDSWIIPHIDEEYPLNTVSIYDRWGGLVYNSPEGTYESNHWDGKYKGSLLPVDSYFYIIEYNDGVRSPTKGSVTILLKK